MKNLVLISLAYVILVVLSIRLTPPTVALENDAASYYTVASEIATYPGGIYEYLRGSTPQFIDRGYPIAIALLIQVFGKENMMIFQIANYIFWIFATLLIYLSLKMLNKAKFASILMLFSPLYLTFTAKIYSEPYASLGTALIIYAITTLYTHPKLTGKIALFFGSFILFSTKSVFLPFIILLIILCLYKKNYMYTFFASLALLCLIPSVIGAAGGGRSLYNLSIQASKLEQTSTEILSCAPYYLSYPLGKIVLPSYQGLCHQNNPTEDMPGYIKNPYLLANNRREVGFTYHDWLSLVISNPFKYLLVMLVSLGNIIFIEGVYPSILTQLPLPVMVVAFVVAKICLSIFLWIKALSVGRQNYLILTPIIYFVLVVTHFPIEPRYFYPLIPYLYFLIGIADNKK